VTVGKALVEGEVELTARRGRRTTKVRVEEIVPRVQQIMAAGEDAVAKLFAS
jgi:hypothetical protein